MPYGMLETFQLSAQSSFGTINVGSLRSVALISESLTHKVEQLQEAAFYNRFGESPRYGGKRSSQGKVSFEPKPTWLGDFLQAACGQSSIGAYVGSLAQWKFRPLNTADWDPIICALPPYSLLVNRQVGSSMTYWDACLNKLSFSCANGQLLKAEADWLGGQYQDEAVVAPSYPAAAEQPWNWSQASVSYGGVALGQLLDLKFDQDNQLELKWTLTVNSGNPTHIKRKGPVKVAGTATFLFVSNSLYYQFLQQATARLVATWEAPNSFFFQVDMPRFRPISWDPVAKNAGAIEATMSFVAEVDPTSAYQVEYTLTNTVAVYP